MRRIPTETVKIDGETITQTREIVSSPRWTTTSPPSVMPTRNSAARTREPGMITRIEAHQYRCFERISVPIGSFAVLVGRNARASPPWWISPC